MAVKGGGIHAGLVIIDLSSDDIEKSASLIRKACEDVGFFYVINHGVGADVIEELFNQSHKFFELPLEEKMRSLLNEYYRGYTPPYYDSIGSQKQSKDCKEGYYIGIEGSRNDLHPMDTFLGPNVWPSSDVLPDWRQTMEKYHYKALNVGRKVARLIALALNLDSNFFDKPEILGEPIALVRLLHYLDEVSNPEAGIYGVGEHSDYGLVTLLLTDGVSGLQICKNKYNEPKIWEDVQPLKGAFIVNIGDMVERWTNGIFRSCLHRVVLSGMERYSVAFFLDPGPDCLIECFESCKSQNTPAKYAPVKYRDYLRRKYIDTNVALNDMKGNDS